LKNLTFSSLASNSQNGVGAMRVVVALIKGKKPLSLPRGNPFLG